jgi:hypothetical protein
MLVGPWLETTDRFLDGNGSTLCFVQIPFFSDFQNIIGSACGAPIVFGWPALFYLMAMKQHNRAVPALDAFLCRLFLFFALPLCFGVGLLSALRVLAESWDEYGSPFDCHLIGYA